LALCLLPSAANADVADDDYTYDDDDDAVYTCNDVCDRANDCDPSCVPSDCTGFCQDTLPSARRDCVVATDCSEFNTCLCNDSDDDDAVDEDDDVDDDDNDDDGCGCSISGGTVGTVLPMLMFGIGILALLISLRSGRREE
jgi:hypothetical protein